MTFRTILLAVLALGAMSSESWAQTPDAAPEIVRTNVYRATAESLLAGLGSDDRPASLARRLRLEIAAGRDEVAEQTADRLDAALRPTQPGRANALVPWKIYLRARRNEAAGMDRDAALKQAFDALYAALPDEAMAAVLPYYGADLDRLRETEQRAAAACAGVVLASCQTAFEAVSARQALETWTYLIPASEPLIRADAERRFIVQDDLLIPTPDGARIATVVVRPRTSEGGKLTALMSFTIYNRDDWTFADAVQMAAHGYAGAVAYTRGKGRGEGRPVPYEHDGQDAATVIDWLAAQEWSDGRVGMFSGSYNGFTQWAALKHRPAALRAIATNATNAPGVDTPMQGNVFQNFMYPWPLYVGSGTGLDEDAYNDRDRWARLNRRWYESGRPYRDMERIDGRANPIFASWLDHPSYDDFWRRMIPQGAEFADIDIPVYVQTGYFDGGMVGALHYLREHYRHRPDADHRLIVGPYHHTAQQSGVLATVNGYEVDRSAQIDLTAIRMQWFDHVFWDAPLPALLSDRINFQVMGADRWRHVASLDAMAERRVRLYLGDDSAGVTHPLTLTPSVDEGPRLQIDLADRSDIDFQLPDEALDTRGALLFVAEPLTEPLEVVGGFTARFEVITNKRDFDLSIILFEQRADGSHFRLQFYLGRVSYADDPGRRRLLEPGVPRTLVLESQTITARRLPAGSRIVALVGVPKNPDTQINYGTGRDVSAESIADAGEPLSIRWAAGGYLELGVRSASD